MYFVVLVPITVFVLLYANGMTGRDAVAILKTKCRSVSHLEFSADGKHLIVGSRGKSTSASPEFYQACLSVWDAAARKELEAVRLPYLISSLALAGDGTKLAVAIGGPKVVDGAWKTEGTPREIRIFAFPAMKELGRLTSDRYVHSISLSPDGKLMAMATMAEDRASGAEVEVVETDGFRSRFTVRDFDDYRTSVQFSPDGRSLAMNDFRDGRKKKGTGPWNRLRLFQSDSGRHQKDLALDRPRGFDSGFFHFHWHPDGKSLIVDSYYISRVATDNGSDTKLTGDPVPGLSSRYTAISRDGNHLVMGSNHDNSRPNRGVPRIEIWDIENNRLENEWVPKDLRSVGPMAISPDKKTLAVGGEHVHLYNLGGK